MTCNDIVLDLEAIAYKSRILKATLFAVNEQLYDELGNENQAVLDGIAESVRELDRDIQKVATEGFAIARKKDRGLV